MSSSVSGFLRRLRCILGVSLSLFRLGRVLSRIGSLRLYRGRSPSRQILEGHFIIPLIIQYQFRVHNGLEPCYRY